MVAVRDSQGNLTCSPFHVKLNKPAQKGDCCRIVKLTVNSKDVALSMKIGSAGEAFFVERTNLKSLSRNPVHPPANSSGFEQGATSKKTEFEIPQHSLFVAAEVNENATRSAISLTALVYFFTDESMPVSFTFPKFCVIDVVGDARGVLVTGILMETTNICLTSRL